MWAILLGASRAGAPGHAFAKKIDRNIPRHSQGRPLPGSSGQKCPQAAIDRHGLRFQALRQTLGSGWCPKLATARAEGAPTGFGKILQIRARFRSQGKAGRTAHGTPHGASTGNYVRGASISGCIGGGLGRSRRIEDSAAKPEGSGLRRGSSRRHEGCPASGQRGPLRPRPRGLGGRSAAPGRCPRPYFRHGFEAMLETPVARLRSSSGSPRSQGGAQPGHGP